MSTSSLKYQPSSGRDAKIVQPDPASSKSADHATEEAKDQEFRATAQLAYLESALGEWTKARAPEDVPAQSEPPLDSAPILAPRQALKPGTVVKSCIAIALATALGWVPVQRLLATTSAEAVVNARIVTLRAPIEGEVTMKHGGTDIGTPFDRDQSILTINNPRADASALAALTQQRGQLVTNISALEAKKQLLESNLKELDTQQERFRLGRIQQIDQRTREVDADIAAAEAQYSVAADALKRADSLRKTDAVSQAFLDKAQGEARVAQSAIRAQIERRKGILVELEAAKKGTFVGDSYNDTPQSAQRKMQTSLELSDVEARLAGSRTELATTEAAIAKETARQKALTDTDIRSTVNGRVWEMLTAPGEHVNIGQDLVKLIDCGSAFVTASVSQTAYERLSIGQAATFIPRDGGPELKGTVVSLNGLSAVNSNTAVQASALSREPYHVTLKFPELTKGFDCRVGRSGLVKFDTSTPTTENASR
ncbi:HlyD family efflux transporter periplasmic adaptor subunit [Hyphomicrobium sp.]|uniref:HlyD family secretion protein n=1 Tax=Hyphomicrobium sp. TaxID=82 RepID=UPI000FA44DDC|nr:HlyD family efflux transporter periplasmic adaptor subunit [Hyphomicrobium sp.]RUO97566.1 MAG: HlyD family efflux transporter periplasmic adaptor subunit [Hyphomicrobium sp.]